MLSKIKIKVVRFHKTVGSVFCRASGFFLLWCLSVFLCSPLAVMAEEYETDIKHAANQGDAQAQYALALLYEYGSETIVRDKIKSLQLLRAAAEKEVAGACLYMGLKYEHGNGITQDFEKAICSYLCAARQDWPMAQFFLADFYAQGKGVKQSTLKALAWLGLARDQGYPGADRDFLHLQKQSGINDFNVLKNMQEKLMIQIEPFCN